MTRVWVVLLLASACGRRDFDARIDAAMTQDGASDALTGHDEDGDGIPDSIDPCPHVAGDMTDTDGDGVGDACDPNPTTPTEHWLMFATMQAGDTAFDDITGFVQEADALHANIAGNLSPSVTINVVKVRVDLGFDIVNVVGGNSQHQVAFGVDNGASPEYYFGELNDNGMGFHDAAIVQYDGMTGFTQLDLQDPGAFHTGSGYSRMDFDQTSHLETGWTGQLYDLTASTSSYAGGANIRFAFNGVDIRVRYLAIISSN